jgi:hypothetical protein
MELRLLPTSTYDYIYVPPHLREMDFIYSINYEDMRRMYICKKKLGIGSIEK